jgi:hypothetical protein
VATNQGLNSAPRASSILSFATTAASNLLKTVQAGVAATVTTHAWARLRRVTFTVADVTDPKKLFDIINRFQENIFGVLGVVTTNQLIPGHILRSVALVNGSVKVLSHGLGRPWQGYFIIRTYTGSAVNILADAAYPPGTTADKVIPLLPAATGTYDIYVF